MSKATPLALPFAESASERTPITRPTNVARSGFHVTAGFVSLALIRVLPGRWWLFALAAAFATFAWTSEFLRRRSPEINAKLMSFFGPVAHAHERHHTNSSTWYVTALALIAAFAPMRGAELAVLVLGLADPAAGVVGRRFGRIQLSANRTLEGTLTFVVVGALASLVWLTATGAAPIQALLVSLIAGTAGALAELGSSRRFDDNFSIPVAVALATGIATSQIAL